VIRPLLLPGRRASISLAWRNGSTPQLPQTSSNLLQVDTGPDMNALRREALFRLGIVFSFCRGSLERLELPGLPGLPSLLVLRAGLHLLRE